MVQEWQLEGEINTREDALKALKRKMG